MSCYFGCVLGHSALISSEEFLECIVVRDKINIKVQRQQFHEPLFVSVSVSLPASNLIQTKKKLKGGGGGGGSGLSEKHRTHSLSWSGLNWRNQFRQLVTHAETICGRFLFLKLKYIVTKTKNKKQKSRFPVLANWLPID